MELWRRLALDPAAHRLVTLVGGCGKTTLLYALARQAVDAGYTVAVTTTTHILPHPGLPRSERPTRALLEARRAVTVGTVGEKGKLTGPDDPAALLDLAGVVLVEGDGANRLPLKAPEEWEPVIPPESRAVLAVAGLDAVGRPIGETCHRPDRAAALVDKPPDALVTAADAARLLTHPLGGRKGVPVGAAFRCVLNKADTPARRAAGEVCAAQIRAMGLQAVLTAFREEERDGKCWF